MTSTRALSLSLVLSICTVAGLVALLLVANASAAPAEPCDPAGSEECCACELSEAAEPAPLPRIYLPSVMHMPRMSAEYTPYVPAPTVTPEVSGDVAR